MGSHRHICRRSCIHIGALAHASVHAHACVRNRSISTRKCACTCLCINTHLVYECARTRAQMFVCPHGAPNYLSVPAPTHRGMRQHSHFGAAYQQLCSMFPPSDFEIEFKHASLPGTTSYTATSLCRKCTCCASRKVAFDVHCGGNSSPSPHLSALG